MLAMGIFLLRSDLASVALERWRRLPAPIRSRAASPLPAVGPFVTCFTEVIDKKATM
jgi:hypothetical protein